MFWNPLKGDYVGPNLLILWWLRYSRQVPAYVDGMPPMAATFSAVLLLVAATSRARYPLSGVIERGCEPQRPQTPFTNPRLASVYVVSQSVSSDAASPGVGRH